MFQYEVLDIPFLVDTQILARIAEKIESITPDIPSQGIVSLSVLPDTRMQELNQAYRNMDATTDVLSFHYFEDFSECSTDEVAGEIVFSLDRLQKQAAELEHSVAEELYRLTLHGTLHLLGFDHELDEEYTEMWALEKQVIQQLQSDFGILLGEVN